MLRTIGWVIWLFAYMLGRLPLSWKMRRLQKQGRLAESQALIDNEVATWAGKLLKHIKVDVTLTGTENLPKEGETVVFVSNHQSYLDIPIVLAAITPPPPLLAKRELGKIPLLGFWMRQLGCVFVERDDARSGMDAMKKAQKTVEDGHSMIIFPEGTRSKGEQMGTFQAGAVRIAVRARAAIVPIAIDGSYRGLEGNGFRLKKASVRMAVLPRVETRDLDRAAQKALPELLAGDIRKAKDEGKGQDKA